MASRPPTRNHRVILECNNNIYICGTKIIKNFEGVLNEGYVKSYDSVSKRYRIMYEEREEEYMTHNEVKNHLKSKRIRRGRVRTRNISSLRGQTNLFGDVLSSSDSNKFGDEFPEHPNENCSIITYQNIGQQPESAYERKSRETAKAFKMSKASIALYTELLICEEKLRVNEKFNDRMQYKNPRSFSVVSSNQRLIDETPWNLVGGTAITIDEGFLAHKTTDGTGSDPERLGRWTWIRLRGRDQIHTRFVSAYRPCKNIGTSTTWTQHLNHFRLLGVTNPDPRKIFDEDLCSEISN